MGDTIIGKALSVMRANIEDPLTSRQIAILINVSQSHLERCFRDILDNSPMMVCLDLRLDRARKLATQTTLPLVETAVASGFASTHILTNGIERSSVKGPPIHVSRHFRASGC
ncbi:helix-turn-helix domain-containing protein [Escherichia coli]|nr:helix-turn-helix domain-containing protein [Escherichia coli]